MNVTISPSAVGDLLQDGLQPLLELTAVLRAGDHRAEVQRDHALVLERLGHVAVDDALCEPLDDRRLADAGLADQHRVVLRAARQHLDRATNLLVAPDHRDRACPARAASVRSRPYSLQRLVLLLGVLVGDALAASDLGERRQDAVAREPGLRTGSRAGARRPSSIASSRCSVEMYSSVSCSASRAGGVEQAAGRRAAARQLAALRVDLRHGLERLSTWSRSRFGVTPTWCSSGIDDALGIREQREQHVLRFDRSGGCARRPAAARPPAPPATSSSACSGPSSSLHLRRDRRRRW